MKDIALVISTCDRYPATNYFSKTWTNLTISGVFTSDRLHSVHIASDYRPDTGRGPWPERMFIDGLPGVAIDHAEEPRYAQGNCATALLMGANSGAKWVLQIEDDIDVVDDFLGSVGRWLDRHGAEDRPLYAFSSDHSAIDRARERGEEFWEYAVSNFWGFQCFAVSAATARDLGQWYLDNPGYKHDDGRVDFYSHDIGVQRWAAERGHTMFRGSVPVFVQHLGEERAVPYPSPKRIYFPSWPGREWTFR